METVETQVTILGGGIGGLWLLYELAKRNCDAVLIQHSTLGTHSSMGNHRWLHSGAYFAAYSMPTVAEQCRESSGKLRQFCQANCRDAISPRWGALLAFISQKEFERIFDAIRYFGIEPMALIDNELNIKEPTLRSDLLRYGLFIKEEATFDPTIILRALASCCIDRGGSIYRSSKPLLDLSIEFASGKWRISDGRRDFTSEMLVCAAGISNPKLLFNINGRNMPNKVESTPVAVFHKSLSEGLLLINHKWMLSPILG